MNELLRMWMRWFRCEVLHHCGGRVVSGIHSDEIWCGWQCADCKRVKHYAPTGKRV